MVQPYTMVARDFVTGDPWPFIAARHGIAYWQNIYLAPENRKIRNLRGDPSLFRAGDVIQIPAAADIQPMENQPVVMHTKVPLFTQSEQTCWRATGRMLYLYKYPKSDAATFDEAIGRRYATMEKGLDAKFWTDFYVHKLGMTEKKLTFYNDLHYLLATRGPVVAAIGEGKGKHSVLIVGYDILKGKWLRLDPASGERFDFPADTIVVGKRARRSSRPKSASSVRFTPAPATWAGMAKWLFIFDTRIHARVFFY